MDGRFVPNITAIAVSTGLRLGGHRILRLRARQHHVGRVAAVLRVAEDRNNMDAENLFIHENNWRPPAAAAEDSNVRAPRTGPSPQVTNSLPSSTPSPAAAPPPRFRMSIRPLDVAVRARMIAAGSWRPDAPRRWTTSDC